MSAELLSAAEVSRHDSPSDCWIVVAGQVWDISQFAPTHPGGASIIYRHAGGDATEAYSKAHPPSTLKDNLPADCFRGRLDSSTISQSTLTSSPSRKPKHNAQALQLPEKALLPPLDSIINADDFEHAAQRTAGAKTWAFYSSAADDLISRDFNRAIFRRIWLRPRVMRDVRTVSTQTTLLGQPSSLPIMVSPAAMARLIHPDGELAIARAAQSRSIIQCISTNASYSASDILSSTSPSNPNHPFFFQLYVDKQRHKTASLLRNLRQNHKNLAAVFVTADAAVAGKREADERLRADESITSPITGVQPANDQKGGGYGRMMGSFIDPALNWADIAWLRQQLGPLPLVLKGVMHASDVKLALDHGLDGVMLGNHGGRNLDTSPSPVVTLLECHRRFPEVFRAEGFEVFVDGGVRRGTDVLKCLALGARAVGLGRPVLFANAYGQEGVERLLDLLRDELETAMRLCGVTCLEEVGPWLVHTGDINHLVPTSEGHPYVQDWKGATTTWAKL